MNHLPALFFPQNEAMSDDIIIRGTYPGGHEAFIDMMLYTKQYQLVHPCQQTNRVMTNGAHTNGVNGKAGAVNGENISATAPHDCQSKGGRHAASHGSDTGVKETNALDDCVNGEVPRSQPKKPLSMSQAIGDFKARGITIGNV